MTTFITDQTKHHMDIDFFRCHKKLTLDMSAETFLKCISDKDYNTILFAIIPHQDIISIIFTSETHISDQNTYSLYDSYIPDIISDEESIIDVNDDLHLIGNNENAIDVDSHIVSDEENIIEVNNDLRIGENTMEIYPDIVSDEENIIDDNDDLHIIDDNENDIEVYSDIVSDDDLDTISNYEDIIASEKNINRVDPSEYDDMVLYDLSTNFCPLRKVGPKISSTDIIFYSCASTLNRSPYFKNYLLLFEFHNKTIRLSPQYYNVTEFMHVLEWMRNPNYIIQDLTETSRIFGYKPMSITPIVYHNNISEKDCHADNLCIEHTNFLLNNNLAKFTHSSINQVVSGAYGYQHNLEKHSDIVGDFCLIIEPFYDWQKCDIDDITDIILGNEFVDLFHKSGFAVTMDLELKSPDHYLIYDMYKQKNILYLPLVFSLAQQYIPIISLQYQTIKIKVLTSTRIKYRVNIAFQSIFLDTEERRSYAQNTLKYLTNNFNAMKFNGEADRKIFLLNIKAATSIIIKTTNQISWAKIFDGYSIFYTDPQVSQTDFNRLEFASVTDCYIIHFDTERNLIDAQLCILFDKPSNADITIGYYYNNLVRFVSGIMGTIYLDHNTITLI